MGSFSDTSFSFTQMTGMFILGSLIKRGSSKGTLQKFVLDP